MGQIREREKNGPIVHIYKKKLKKNENCTECKLLFEVLA